MSRGYSRKRGGEMKKRELQGWQKTAIRHRIRMEHERFYYRMISRHKKKIYHRCHEIQFMECLYEYFMYADLKEQHVRACLVQNDIMGTLWQIYLEREHLRADTWEEIEGMLDALAERQENEKGEFNGEYGKNIPKI